MNYGYLRVSTDKQEVQSQREIIDAWAAAHNTRIDRWVEDVGEKRHSLEKRPGWQRLLLTLEPGDQIIVESQLRVGGKSRTWELQAALYDFQQRSVRLWDASRQLDLTSGEVLANITSVLASEASKEEQEERARRSIKGKVQTLLAGEWVGGHCPFAYDVECQDHRGTVKWRLIFQGRDMRLKIDPDGTTTRYDGKDNLPGRDQCDRLILTLGDPAKVKLIRELFGRYANETVSFGALARYANSTGIKPTYSSTWLAVHVASILANPLYTGRPSVNKRYHGAYLTSDGRGGFLPVPRQGVKPKPGKRPKEQWVSHEEPRLEIVDGKTWDNVQAKLKSLEKVDPRSRSPKNPVLWLSGVLYCGACGARLEGWAPQSRNYSWAYLCPNQAKKRGCPGGRATVKWMDSVVRKFLDATDQWSNHWREYIRGILPMLKEGGHLLELNEKLMILDSIIEDDEVEETPAPDKINDLDAEHSRLIDVLIGTPPMARRKIQERLESIEREIERLRQDDSADRKRARLEEELEVTRKACAALLSNQPYTSKSAAIRRLVDRILIYPKREKVQFIKNEKIIYTCQ